MSAQRVVRRNRLQTHTFRAAKAVRAHPLGAGTLRILGGFLVILVVGTGLLMLPVASAGNETTSFSEALFTAVSAMTVTGLVVVETQTHFTLFGEAVILALIQVGGLGYMVGVTMVIWIFGRQIGLRDRNLLRQYYGAPSMSESLRFARRMALFALTCEAIGVVVLYAVFVRAGVGADTSVWWSIFHAISAFNNAGFNVTGADMLPYATDPLILGTITLLVVTGGVGALPILALVERRRNRHVPLDHVLIFAVTGILLVVGTVVILALEWGNDATLGGVPAEHRPMLALFQGAMPRTAGFTAVPLGGLHDETRFFTVGLMFIGGAAGSTAGGIKVGAFSLLFFVLIATLRGRTEVVVLGRLVPMIVIRQAVTIALLGVAAAFTSAMVLATLSDEPFVDVLLESVSALATVGHSAGMTPELGTAGRIVLMATMLAGRFGPLVLVLEMNRPKRTKSIYITPEDSIRLG